MSNEIFRLVSDIFIDYAESSARNSDIGRIYLDMVGAQGYRNRAFEDAVNLFMDNLDRIERQYSRSGFRDERDVEDALIRVIPQFVDGHTATMVLSNDRISQRFDDRLYNDLLRAAEDWQREWISSGYGRDSRQTVGSYGAGRGNTRGGGYYANQSRGGNRDRKDWFNTGNNNNHDSGIVIGGPRRGGNTRINEPMHGRFDNLSVDQSSKSSVKSAWGSLSNVPIETPASYVNEPAVTVNEAPTTNTTPVLERKVIDVPDVNRPYDLYQGPGGYMYRSIYAAPIHKFTDPTGAVGTIDEIPSFVDINYGHLVYKEVDGKFYQEAIELDEDARYIQHELMLNRKTTGVVSPVRINHNHEKEEGDTYMVTETEDRRISLVNILKNVDFKALVERDKTFKVFSTMNELCVKARFALREHPEEDVAIMRGMLTNIVFIDTDIKEVHSLLLEMLISCRTLKEARHFLTRIRAAGHEGLFQELNKRFNKYLIPLIQFQWRLPIKTFDFYEHFDPMCEAMARENGEEVLNLFNQRTTGVIEMAVSYVEPKDYSNILTDFGIENEDDPVVVFTDEEYLVSIRRTSDELGIGRQLEDRAYGTALVSHAPDADIREIVRGIYRNIGISDVRMRNQMIRLVTLDNQMTSLIPFYGRVEEFVMGHIK